MWPAIGAIGAAAVGAGTKVYGGMMADSATAAANASAMRQRKQDFKYRRKMDRKNIQLQKEFAQNSIRWKVADAEAAGISPLYALGAPAMSFSPVSAGGPGIVGQTPETGLANALADSGQDISRAIHATRTQSERDRAYVDSVHALQLQNMGLQNELLGSQIAKLAASANPPMPGISGGPVGELMDQKAETVPRLQGFGWDWITQNRTSSGQTLQQRYGDEGPIAWAAGVPALLDDLWRNSVLGRYVYGDWPFNK